MRTIWLLICAAVVVLRVHPARAAGVVGAGTPDSCTEATLDAALAGGGVVTFDCGGAATIVVTSTTTISADATVDGGGVIILSGADRVGVFAVDVGVTFTVQDLTIAHGSSTNGGGISNSGDLTISNSTFTGNRAQTGGAIVNGTGGTVTISNSTFSANSGFIGGAISNGTLGNGTGGTVTVTNSTFAGNGKGASAPLPLVGTSTGGTDIEPEISACCGGGNIDFSSGGAIFNRGTLAVATSTFSGNRAGTGGAIANGTGFAMANGTGGTVTITNSTFTGHGAGGGAISNRGVLTVTNSTFAGNSTAVTGVAIGGRLGTVFVANSILADSTGGNCGGAVTDGGHNIDDGTTCGFRGNGCTMKGGSSFCNTNPQLDPAGLAGNGGPTQTIALEPGSPAIDAGNRGFCAEAPVNNLDQRGFPRPGAGHTHCSVGAYEADLSAPAPCVGDCNAVGRVSIEQLLTLVDIVLGSAQSSACAHGVPSGAPVDIGLIMQAVNHVLDGCPTGSCGDNGERCCFGHTCNTAGLVCNDDDECVACGSPSQRCCAHSTCSSGLVCTGACVTPTPIPTSTPTTTSTQIGFCGAMHATCTPTVTPTFTATPPPTDTPSGTPTQTQGGVCGAMQATCTPTSTATPTEVD